MTADLPDIDPLAEPDVGRPKRPARAAWIGVSAAVAVLLLAIVATGRSNDASPVAAARSAAPAGALPSASEPLDVASSGNAAPVEGSSDGFSVATTSGVSFSVPAGRPTVLFFMTTEGCASCVEEAGALNAVAGRWGDRAAILAIEMVPGTPTEYVDTFAEFMGGLRYPVAVDDGQLVRRFGARTLDTTVVLDGAGREVFRDQVPTDEATLEDALTRAT